MLCVPIAQALVSRLNPPLKRPIHMSLELLRQLGHNILEPCGTPQADTAHVDRLRSHQHLGPEGGH